MGDINPWMPEPNAVVHQALGKLGEEVGELSQIVARCLIQGFTASEPVTLKANRDRIAEEIVDVEAAIQWLKEVTNLGIHEDWVEARRLKKLDGFRRWQVMICEAYAGDDNGEEATTNDELAAVGQSVMNWIDELTQQEGPLKDWTPAESPAEVIPDLYNMLEESFACHRQACEETKQLAAELATEWMPIDTAQKKSVDVILRIPKSSHPGYREIIGHWAEDLSGSEQPPFRGWFHDHGYGYNQITPSPTHWRPLPKAKEGSANG